MARTIVVFRCPARELGESVEAGRCWRNSDWTRVLCERTDLTDGTAFFELQEPAAPRMLGEL